MINRVELKNFGPINELDWQNLGNINLIIGNNDCGKSFLLKSLYSAMRSIEEYKRGDNPDTIDSILRNKLYWTFQPEKITNLIAKQNDNSLLCELIFNNKKFSYSFDNESIKTQDFKSVENKVSLRPDNSIFLPAKEILSLHHLILKTRQQDQLFGFDDTYLDLAIALQIPATEAFPFSISDLLPSDKQGRDSNEFNQARHLLKDLIDGEIAFDERNKRWYFHKDKQRFPMGVTAEGIKKIAILDTLLGNGYLNEKSIIFIDELESALHPDAISKLLDIITILAKHGIQFFIASHSYFVVKKLFLIAQEEQMSIPVLSKEGDNWVSSDLLDDMLDNPIIDESINLYEKEVDLAFK